MEERPIWLDFSYLRRWQIAPIEDHQSHNATDEADDDWHRGIPAGNVMRGERLNALRVVERLDLLHPGEVIGEATQRVHQIKQSQDADGCSTRGAAGIHE